MQTAISFLVLVVLPTVFCAARTALIVAGHPAGVYLLMCGLYMVLTI